MKKFLLSFSLILAFLFYVMFQRARTENLDIIPSPADKSRQITVTPAGMPGMSGMPGMPGMPAQKMFKDGDFTGLVADAYYGNVRVQAVIRDGKIDDVLFLDHPGDRKKSVEINGRAMPLLTAETIRAQSARVDIVSGATLTSQAFIESLGDALTQAKN